MEGARIFHARISELDVVMIWIREIIVQIKSDSIKSKKLEVAIEETLMNIIHYAYAHPPGLIEITYIHPKNSHEIQFTFKDQGKPFNPLEDGKFVNIHAPIHERLIGGLGIHFMHQLTDKVEYQRVGDSNVLRLSSKI